MKSEHLEKLRMNCLIRIGTLFDYRNDEKYGMTIGDSGEGTSEAYDYTNYDLSKPETLPKIAHEVFKVDPNLKNSYVKNLQVVVKRQSLNYYLYCTSLKLDRKLLHEFKCDCIVRINDPLQFFHLINIELRRLGLVANRMYIVRCLYQDRKMNHTDPNAEISPALLKDKRYQQQAEVRTVWAPDDRFIEPVNIVCSGIDRLIEKVNDANTLGMCTVADL